MPTPLKIANIETLYFDRIYGLHGLTLEVKENEIFAVLGPNGAGKTRLLTTITGLGRHHHIAGGTKRENGAEDRSLRIHNGGGRTVLEWTSKELQENEDVQELYLGLIGESASPGLALI